MGGYRIFESGESKLLGPALGPMLKSLYRSLPTQGGGPVFVCGETDYRDETKDYSAHFAVITSRP